MAFKLIKPVS